MKNEKMKTFLQKSYLSLLAKFLLVGVFLFFQLNVSAQERTISGKVTDAKNEPLTGVTVLVKGTTIGTLTNLTGEYSLAKVPQNATLVFTFIGMTSQEIIPLNGQSRIDVVMKEAMLTLEEVVVIGYGTQKKQSTVGAINQTTNADLQRAGNVTNVAQALTGQLPGVITITSDAQPGGYTNQQNSTAIYIRGMNTWNGGQALILVDGIERPIDKLDVSQIETVSVLKDASATAVFGVRGANGVVLVTTKRGTAGKPKLSFTYNATALTISKLPQQYDSYATQQIRDQAIEREVSLNQSRMFVL